jgi:polyisoprenyl-phosphate glycosyltransferase
MKKIIILIPLYNDWESAIKLLKNIDEHTEKLDIEISVLLVNDASLNERPKVQLNLKKIKLVQVINMKKNRGHARCNAAGLKYIIEKKVCDYIILMDGDGEDRPEELEFILKKSSENPTKVVTANRIKRSEGPFFKILYIFHKILTFVFTGKHIKFGNFSCLPKEAASNLIKESCIWSSFSGSIVKTIPDRVSIPSIRGSRYFGPSKMNLLSLVLHSFSIIAIFRKTVLVRSILFLILYLFFIFNNLSIINLFPVLIILVFLLSIFKISSRENLKDLNNSLENIGSIDNLSNSDSW